MTGSDEMSRPGGELTAGIPEARLVGATTHGDATPTIRQSLDRLTARAREVLSSAAVLGTNPLVTETAELVGCDTVTVLDAVKEGATTGVVALTGDGEGRFEFSHDQVRAAAESDLATGDRLEAHARAALIVADATYVEPTAQRLARAAHHARWAASRSADDARHAVSICRAAGQALVHIFDYEQADVLLSAAIELHEAARLGPPDARLAVEWAEVASLRGYTNEARSRFRTAVTRAEAEGAPALLAEAALGLAGLWLDEYDTPVEKTRVLGLCRRALADLPAGEPDVEALRCRLVTRLAAEETFTGGPAEPLHEAVDAARRCGDPHTLAEALSLTHHALFTPEHTRTRLALADELVQLTSETDQGTPSLMGLLWRTIDLMHLGDGQAPRALEVLRQRATLLGNRHILYNVAVIDALMLINRGLLADAEAKAQKTFELGAKIGRVDSAAYLAAQLTVIRWMQGRDSELIGDVDEITTSPSLSDTEIGFRAALACLAARAGDHEHARATVDRYLPDNLADLAPSGTWLGGLVAIAEAAHALGEQRLAGQTYDLLRPFADLPTIVGLGIVCLGSTERPLGVAASTLGRHDLAVDHLERAVSTNQRYPNRPMLAISRAELAQALIRRIGPTRDSRDRDRAAALLDQAIGDGTAMGLTGRVADWQSELKSLEAGDRTACQATGGGGADGDGPQSRGKSNRPGSPPARRGVIRQEGRRWMVAVDDRSVRVANLVGMAYLAELLTHPRQHIPAFVLAGHGDAGGAAPQVLLDDEARTAYVTRARELHQDLSEAEAANDLHRAERLRAELDTLVEHLEAATGLGQRPRRFADDNERARTAVRKAIKRAIDTIADADASIADTIRDTISTGAVCTYTPDHQNPVAWSTAQPIHRPVF